MVASSIVQPAPCPSTSSSRAFSSRFAARSSKEISHLSLQSLHTQPPVERDVRKPTQRAAQVDHLRNTLRQALLPVRKLPAGKVQSTTRAARMESAQVALGDPSIPGSAEMHGEVPQHWNWMKWISKSGEEFKGNWGDWRFFDLEGKVTKHFRGKRQGRCNPERTVWTQRNFHDTQLSPDRAFNEAEQMWEMQWHLEKATSSLPEGLMHSFMPSARIATFDEHTRCLVQRDLSGKADSYGWETSYDDGKYHTSITPMWRQGAFSSCGVIREKWESWPDEPLDTRVLPLEAALGKLTLKRVRQVTWPQPGGTGAMRIDDVSDPVAWPTTALGYHEIAMPISAWAVGPSALPEVGASDGFWISTAKRFGDGGIKRIVHVFMGDTLIEKVLLEEYMPS